MCNKYDLRLENVNVKSIDIKIFQSLRQEAICSWQPLGEVTSVAFNAVTLGTSTALQGRLCAQECLVNTDQAP